MHDGRLPADRDHYFDGFRVNRRFMRDVIFITKEQLKRVHPERQGNLCLGLARSEMEVIGVAGNGLIERRQRRIDQEMVMAGIVLFKSRRRDTHAYQPKPYGRRLGHVAAIGRIFEIDLRIWGRSMASNSPCGRGLSARFDVHQNTLGHDRRIVRDVILVSQQKLQSVVARSKRDIRLGLARSEMEVIGIGGN